MIKNVNFYNAIDQFVMLFRVPQSQKVVKICVKNVKYLKTLPKQAVTF